MKAATGPTGSLITICQACDRIDSVTEQFTGPTHDRGTLMGRHPAPCIGAPFCGSERLIQVSFSTAHHIPDEKPCRWIDDGKSLLIFPVYPFVSDQQLRINTGGRASPTGCDSPKMP